MSTPSEIIFTDTIQFLFEFLYAEIFESEFGNLLCTKIGFSPTKSSKISAIYSATSIFGAITKPPA